jgi:two-component system NarL family sensor kinase
LDPALKQNIYLVFKESINNIIKHANASKVEISLHQKSNYFEMIIQDNGQGFHLKESFTGHGLRNMKRRAKAIGATFDIQNKNGTTIVMNCTTT